MATFNNHQMTKEELLANDYREYRGKEMNVYFKAEICQHAPECVRGNLAVFNPKQKPWINADAAKAEEIKEIINRCPSYALQYEREMV